MEKLITFNYDFDRQGQWKQKFLMYDNIIIVLRHLSNGRQIILFYDIYKREPVWKSFNPKMANNLDNIYVDHGRLVIVGNGKCKIFDLRNNLEILHKFAFPRVYKCSFCNDGNTILLSNDKNEIKVINLLTGEIIGDFNYNVNMIFDDYIYSFNHSTQSFDIFDLKLNKTGYDDIKIAVMHMNHDSRYDFTTVGTNELKIHDKLTSHDFTLNHGKYFKNSGHDYDIDVIEDILVASTTKNYENEYHVGRIMIKERNMEYLGCFKGGKLYNLPNNILIHLEKDNIYTIYSTKGELK